MDLYPTGDTLGQSAIKAGKAAYQSVRRAGATLARSALPVSGKIADIFADVGGKSLCRKLLKGKEIWLNAFVFTFKSCVGGVASFVFTSVRADLIFSFKSVEDATERAQEWSDEKADRFCAGEGDLYLLADENGNLIVSEESNVIITN